MVYRGWHQVAFEREIQGEIAPILLEGREMLLVKRPEGLRAFDAFCPHRGAHLGRGGRIEGDQIVCPFHGRRIGLCEPGDDGFRLRNYRT
ncbi:MAG TPA: Rieske 2Fe-2S domain-containing protein, partial [Thermoanaerobaculia bacterium]|nr:Rieske 2Fe-2S domain-containing protein [Thermoanaerobaculia bacterium]